MLVRHDTCDSQPACEWQLLPIDAFAPCADLEARTARGRGNLRPGENRTNIILASSGGRAERIEEQCGAPDLMRAAVPSHAPVRLKCFRSPLLGSLPVSTVSRQTDEAIA